MILVLCLGAGSASLATFVGQGTSDSAFTSGTITLGLAPASSVVAYPGMVAGNQVASTLTVQNVGSGALRYSMAAGATNPDGKLLRDALQITVERRTGCGGAVLETLYDGPAGLASFGDSHTGADPGDRTLGPSASEVLCVRATLPADTDPQYGSAAMTLTFSFVSEQTSNNP